jgi:hypothetical protein
MKYINSSSRFVLINLLILGIGIIPSNTFAQSRLNFGLSQPQQTSTLPKSNAPFQTAMRVAKQTIESVLKPEKDGEYVLFSGWEMREAEKVASTGETISKPGFQTSSWYNATVPGTVLTTLVQQGVYPDPYFGLNNLSIPDTLCRMDWWYRLSFRVPTQQANKTTFLVLNGINYRAIVWLNGKKIGKMSGAFVRGEFNVTDVINFSGENVLSVQILPPPNPGIPQEESPSAGQGPNGGQLCLDGPTFISSEGWDWVPGIRDRNIGIWQDVRLRFTRGVIISNPQVITDLALPDTTLAKISVNVQVQNTGSVQQTINVTGSIENITFSQEADLKAGEQKTIRFTPKQFSQLNFKNPRLWWPNGYGKQNFYTLQLKVTSGETLSDEKSVRFGIRELSYELNVDAANQKGRRIEFNPIKDIIDGKPVFDNNSTREYKDKILISSLHKDIDPSGLTSLSDTTISPYMVIRVNGQRIFCKGGNWGMDDAMKQSDRKHLEPYFRLHKDANFTMIRNWTGESTEEAFYELADEYGLLVWNDFWLSTQGYNLDVNDNLLFLDNAREVVRRFRNHPSIAVWCARNEGVPLPQLEAQLENLIAAEDPTRHYNPNSRVLNLRWSGPWNYFKDPSEYFRNNASGFNTELGTPSIPTAESMRKMMAPQDLWPISDVWFYHDLHDGQKDMIEAISRSFGEPKDLDDFCKKAQMLNYESHRAMFEAWNSKLWNNTSGLLLWMTHPAWPSTVWQVYSWDYETFGSYFACKKACEPVHIQMNLHDNKVIVINTTLKSIQTARAVFKLYTTDGKLVSTKEVNISVPANVKSDCFVADLPAKGVYLARLTLLDEKGKVICENSYWKQLGETKDLLILNSLAQVKLRASILKKQNGSITFNVKNSSKTIAVSIKLNLRDKSTGKAILPAYFTDGYFNLLSAESKTIKVDYDPLLKSENLILTADGYNVEGVDVK